ncbi:cilia- and flagella-associated protein 418-like [Liolophura sinensis]|uniref:cilia- and flagella-associated protein 418-like n=1 Tax=Liolophura sinensis TaxID=3198878 RepID=UPI003158A15A
MADDIDDLLDEVENKFCSKKKISSTSKSRKKPVADDELNKMIDDICEVPTEMEDKLMTKRQDSTQSIRDTERKKCYPVYLGGTSSQDGIATSLSKRSCNALRCTSCDFKVSVFDNLEWSPDTDYLFLRNNAPDFQKLKSGLLSRTGSRAYCCQCSWRSVEALMPLQDPQLRWVCGKH